MRTKSILAGGAVLIIVASALSGCLKTVDSPNNSLKTYLSVMHLAPAAPSVETYFDDTKVSQALSSGNVFTVYSGVDPGTFGISFKKSSSDSVVASIPAAVYDSLKFHTLLLYNDQYSSGVKAARIADDFSGITTNTASIRFFHVSPDIEAVDVYLDNSKIMSGRQYVDNVINSSYNVFSQYTPGFYAIQVKKAGSDSLIMETSTNLLQQNAYTIFLNGLANGTGNNALGLDVLQARN